MLLRYRKPLVLTCLLSSLTGCGLAVQQLADKAREDQLLQPGTQDIRLTGVYDQYRFKFMERYRVIHDWPRNSNGCRYRMLSAIASADARSGDIFSVEDIFESDGDTRFLRGWPAQTLNAFVRPEYIRKEPERDSSGKLTGKIVETHVKGSLTPICFQAWAGTSHVLVFSIIKRESGAMRENWTKNNPVGKWSEVFIGDTHWWEQVNSPEDLRATGVGGWYQNYFTEIAGTGYTISLQLGASQQSLLYPEAHLKFKTMLRHLLESVKIEVLTPEIDAENKRLQARAEQLVRDECNDSAKNGKMPKWCDSFLRERGSSVNSP